MPIRPIKSFGRLSLNINEKDFGQTVVYGKDTNLEEIISLAHSTINYVSDNNEVEDGLDNLKNDETIKNQLDAFSEIEL